MINKKCLICNIEQPIDNFYNKKVEKDGKHRYCKSCMKKEKKEYYTNTKEDRKIYHKQYRVDNKEYFNNYCHNHYHTKKELYRDWERNRLKTDLSFRLKKVVGVRINQALKTYNSLKQDRTIEYLGCNMEEYTLYLESKFKPEWNWDNYGTEWEIDHIKPICKFNLLDEEEMYKCFHFSNTQPLSKTENREKSGTYLE